MTSVFFRRRLIHGFALLLALVSLSNTHAAETYDVVIIGGRVIDPESGLDAIRNIGIRGEVIAAITDVSIKGDIEVNANGLVVTPGFIDLHAHGQSARSNEFQAMDGVTTALELEGGVPDMPLFLAMRQGNAVINYGASISHLALRTMAMPEHADAVTEALEKLRKADNANMTSLDLLVLGAAGSYSALDPVRYPELWRLMGQGLNNGALGVGMPHQYYPGVTYDEIFRVFQFAAAHEVPIYTHVRSMGVAAMQEVIANATATGAPLHIVHMNSSSLGDYQTNLDLILGAQERGLDVTTEAYPYTAASTAIESAIFDEGWQEKLGITYKDVQWQDTGERLTEATFEQYREQGGIVIIHIMKPEWIKAQLADPRVMVASDGMPYAPGAHPRSAGTFSRFIGRYVRDMELMSLTSGLAKISLQPALRLEKVSPQMKRKGRLQIGSDADIAVFDYGSIIDTADFESDLSYSKGMKYVLVNGEFVVWDAELVEGARPGRAVLGGAVVFQNTSLVLPR
jgi:N-acyl-D-aspartate/D-glutamate deacylase